MIPEFWAIAIKGILCWYLCSRGPDFSRNSMLRQTKLQHLMCLSGVPYTNVHTPVFHGLKFKMRMQNWLAFVDKTMSDQNSGYSVHGSYTTHIKTSTNDTNYSLKTNKDFVDHQRWSTNC